MKDLQRNKQKIYYALFEKVEDTVDWNGLYTGEKTITYGDPTELYINVSGAMGSDEVIDFGVNTPYDRIMITADISCPIDEYSVLWLEGADPDSVAANYRVVAKRKTLNSIVYAIAKVSQQVL